MNKPLLARRFALCLISTLATAFIPALHAQDSNPLGAENTPEILTPAAPHTPRINGPSIFGVRPDHPFLYHIPATGDRPMSFSVEHLPGGLSLDVATGNITGTLHHRGTFTVTLHAKNSLGTDDKKFKIVVGETIALTPPMGWSSWPCWAGAVDQDKVLTSARAMVTSGLIDHGWSYVNIDDTWQGKREGPLFALQPNDKFPGMKDLCDQIHAMGLKAGIYSTPWVTSYASYPGGSSDNREGLWSKTLSGDKYRFYGKYDFSENDAKQWDQWGFDYMKYDWRPNDLPHVEEMSKALRRTGRDIVFSLSNSAPIKNASGLAKFSNCWRTCNDIWDGWKENPGHGADYNFGISEIIFSQDRWAPYAGPGHWNDLDTFICGEVGWGPNLHPVRLSADEQYTQMSMWCMLCSPLLIGCNLEHLDPFTLGLLSNDEVLAINQDALGIQAVRVAAWGVVDIFMKPLEDGSKALGFFNRGDTLQTITFNKLPYIGFAGAYQVRDLWRQKDLDTCQVRDITAREYSPDGPSPLKLTIAAHGVILLKLTHIAEPPSR